MNETELTLLWAKLGHGTFPRDAHPVVCHLLDVGHVCKALWCSSISAVSRDQWSDTLGCDVETAGQWIAFWAASHDIGKVIPGFQFRSKEAKRVLKRLGYAIAGDQRPHGVVSAKVLAELFATSSKWPALPHDLARDIAVATAGHHGVVPGSGEWSQIGRPILGREKWDDARREIIAYLANHFRVVGSNVPQPPVGSRRAFLLFLAGLVAVADWVGSNQTFFPSVGVEVDLQEYVKDSVQNAHRALHELGWNRWTVLQEGPRSFQQVHPAIANPRPLQERCVQIAHAMKEPTLVLIEAPMGEGKTEAAVFLADHATHVLGNRGLYIALPTQATANQMFQRLESYLRERYAKDGDESRVNLQLLHGRMEFSDRFADLLRLAGVGDDTNDAAGRSQANSPSEHVVAETWFAQNKKQAILAPFGVGTIDQALLAVLQTKHHFVRLFGLAGKTIILDEVHAYDAYMTTLMERLCSWLAGLGCPVVLLSATLPREKRRKLVEAYVGTPVDLPDDAYPRVTVARRVDGNPTNDPLVSSCPVATDPRRRATVGLRWLPEGDVIDDVYAAVAGGGCVGIVCNTVRRSQQLYEALSRKLDPVGVDVSLFHARFPLGRRMEIENQVLATFGPPEKCPSRPGRAVLIATQVIEQGLDLDFDLLVSEVAPIDLILQRAGRLHRHERAQRPAGLEQPQLWLVEPPIDADGIPDFGPFQTYPKRRGAYDRHILIRSYLALAERKTIMLPDDVETLVEAVYSDFAPTALNDAWNDALAASWAETQRSQNDSEANAVNLRIPDPAADNLLEQHNRGLEEDNPDVHRHLQAMTREGDPSLTLVLLHRVGDALCLDPDGHEAIDLLRRPNPDQTRRLLERSVSISNKLWVRHFKQQPINAGWLKSGALCYARHVPLDSEGCYRCGSHTFRLNPRMGVVLETDQREEDATP